MPKYEYQVGATSGAPVETVWAILIDSLRWPEWTGLPTPTINREGDPPPFGLGAIRTFGLGPVAAEEEVEVWEPPHRYGYALRRFPVRNYHAVVTLEPREEGTAITWQGRFDASTLPLMSRPMLWGLRTMIGRLARKLARHAEKAPRPTP